MMALIDSMPHRCSIGRVIRSNDALGGNRFNITVEQINVECWEQRANASTISVYEKRGIKIDTSVYFAENPNVTERHRILITKRLGVAQSNLDITEVDNPDVLDVMSYSYPDASAGQGVLWRVECNSDRGGSVE